MKNILILNAGTRDTLVKYFKKTCSDRCKIITTDNYVLAPALYETDRHYVTKRWDEPGYLNDIEKICIEENIGLMVSLVDPELELLAENKDIFEKLGILVNISEPDVVKSCFDKYYCLEFIRKNGFNYIKSYVEFEMVEQALACGEIEFPLITKPRKGSGSAGIEMVYSLRRLKEICDNNKDTLIQEYIEGQEIGVDVYVDMITNEVISIFAKKKLKMRAGETDKSVSFKNQELFDIIIRFAKCFGLKGVNDIDVFENDGEYYISEINPRFGGGYLHAYAAGIDFIELLVNNMNGKSNISNIGNYEEQLYMMKYFDIKVMREEELL